MELAMSILVILEIINLGMLWIPYRLQKVFGMHKSTMELTIFNLTENDLVVEETLHKSQMSTVLMIDISHSMILYGEDRITPAKKVAMALAELITTRYPKDTLEIIVFGNDAWSIKIKDLPYLQVGALSYQYGSWIKFSHGFTP